jgi:hypothetical protein
MKRNLIIFDVDKTLFCGNLHELIIEKWMANSRTRAWVGSLVGAIKRMLPHPALRRRFEYFLISFISSDIIYTNTLYFMQDEKFSNLRLLNRIARYKQHHFDVALITAAPHKVVGGLARELNVSVHASRTFLGLVIVDLLGNKSSVYQRIETADYRIRVIYSDSPLDFWPTAKNYLITGNKMELSTL